MLQQLRKDNCETGHVEGFGGAIHKNPKMGFENRLNPVVKVEKVDVLEKRLEWNHQVVTSLLWELLDVVPTTKLLGEQCGSDIQWLQGERNGLEIDLQNVRDTQKQRVVKMCALQMDEVSKGPGAVLQTTTIPLSEVRNELGEWKEAMEKEYRSLVHETKTIEPAVDLSMLNPENVEFVPGKLVTVRKAGPNGGKKKCRAVVCGNLLQSDLDPAPGNLYASGADGILCNSGPFCPTWLGYRDH